MKRIFAVIVFAIFAMVACFTLIGCGGVENGKNGTQEGDPEIIRPTDGDENGDEQEDENGDENGDEQGETDNGDNQEGDKSHGGLINGGDFNAD